MVTRGWGVEGNGERLVRGYRLPVVGWVSSKFLMAQPGDCGQQGSGTWALLWERVWNILSIPATRKCDHVRGRACRPTLLWWRCHGVCVYRIITQYSLDLNTVYIICQVYLSKMGCGTWREDLTVTNFLLTKSYQRGVSQMWSRVRTFWAMQGPELNLNWDICLLFLGNIGGASEGEYWQVGKPRIQNRKSNTAGLENRTGASRILISSERKKRILNYLKASERRYTLLLQSLRMDQ